MPETGFYNCEQVPNSVNIDIAPQPEQLPTPSLSSRLLCVPPRPKRVRRRTTHVGYLRPPRSEPGASSALGFDFALECRQVEGNTTAGSISGSPILTRNNCLSATRSLRLTSRPMFIWIIARECLGSSCSSTQRLHSPDCVALSRRSGGMLGWAGAEERCDEGTQQRVRCWALRSNRWLAVFTEPRLRCSFLQPHHPPRRLPRLRYVVFWASSLM